MTVCIDVTSADRPAACASGAPEVDGVAESMDRSPVPLALGDLFARALDEVDFGLMVLNAQGRPIFANRTALRSCGAGAPIQLEHGRLVAACEADAVAFAKAMQQAVEGRRSLLTFEGPGDGDEAGGLATARFLGFIPLPADNPRAERAGTPGVLLVFGRQQMCGPLSVQFFARQHSVTLAESSVLTGLCNGRSPRRIAEEQGIAMSTVRTHILRIREKTGCSSILDLLRVVSMLPPLLAVGA